MSLLKQAMTGEGGLLKRAGTERTPRREKLDSFTLIVNEIWRILVAACRWGRAGLRRRGESGGGTEREHGVLSKGQLLVRP